MLTFPQYPEWTAVVAKFTDVPAATLGHVSTLIHLGQCSYCILNTTYIVLSKQLEYAIYQTIQREEHGNRKAKTLATEIFSNLSPDKNIGEALRRFGLLEGSTEVVAIALVKGDVGNTAEEMAKLFEKEPTQITEEAWWQLVDLKKVRKVYKLNDVVDLKEDQESYTNLVIGACVLRLA